MAKSELVSSRPAPMASASASLIVVHRPWPMLAPAYEAWLKNVRSACRAFSGHIGAEVVRPAEGQDGDYTVIVRFETREQLDAWLHSPERAEAVARLGELLATEESVSVSVGDDIWFTAGASASMVPRRYKQFLVTFAFLFPLSLLIQPLMAWIAPRIGLEGGAVLVKAATTAALVALLLWVVFPLVTPRLRRWLTA